MDKKWQFYLNPLETWAAMYEECIRAVHTIDLEQYIFNLDKVGKQFLELFLKKAASGVKVRMLIDAAGSFEFFYYLDDNELRKRGVDVRFYNPISPWRIKNYTSWLFRDHRKFLIVDGERGFTGGVGINAKMSSWRDTEVKMEGPAVSEMRYSFDRMWEMAKARKYLMFKKPTPDSRGFMVLTNAPHRRQRFVYYQLLSSIRSATKCAYLATAYFIPIKKLLRELKAAARRGVDVRLMISKTSDHKIVGLAMQSYFSTLLKSGVRIFQYQPAFLHVKTAVVDDIFSMVGSTNLDNLSLTFNHEANIASTWPPFAAELKSQFLGDSRQCLELNYREWKRRPFVQKFLEFLVKPLHGLL